MSSQEQPNNPPIELTLLDENKKIVVLNNEHPTILEQIKKELEADKYNSIVTMENFSVMDEASKELGKTSKFINRFRIDKKDSEMSDIKTFEENLKGYCSLIEAKQQTIKDGLEVFKEETRKKVLNVCTVYLGECLNELGIREEFRDIDIKDMTLTGYMTKGGVISKKGKDEVIRRVNEKNQLQTKVDNRILSLENECLKANIQPLTVEHIQGFLYTDDTTYNEKLQSLIDAEIKRNEQVKEQARIEAEKEAKEKVLKQQEALKTELHARYENLIKTADIPTLTRINIELKSYDENATYELRQLSNDRQRELESPVSEVDETPKEQHLQDIANEPVKQELKQNDESNTEKKAVDGKVEKTLSIKIRVPESATDEQVVGAVINMIKAGTFPLENIEVK